MKLYELTFNKGRGIFNIFFFARNREHLLEVIKESNQSYLLDDETGQFKTHVVYNEYRVDAGYVTSVIE